MDTLEITLNPEYDLVAMFGFLIRRPKWHGLKIEKVATHSLQNSILFEVPSLQGRPAEILKDPRVKHLTLHKNRTIYQTFCTLHQVQRFTKQRQSA